MNPIAVIILWAFTGLLVVGGLVGFIKAKSKASLIASVGCAIPLALVAAGKLPGIVAIVVLGLLQAVFAIRWAKTKSFMPAGLILILSMLTELAMIWFLYVAPKS